ncbi:MAG: guanylate kinase [Deferribacteres bacterium]|nr:guanylate kinase [Deferribacteres bacterium]
MIKRKKGIIFVVSAPSGAGKTTFCRRVLSELEGIVFSVSYTTRPPRENEVHGRDYFFVSREEFLRMVEEGKFVEYAEVYGNLYGTSKEFIEGYVEQGVDVLLDIDVQGAEKILSYYSDAVGIFIFPPSLEVLRQRLLKRGTDAPEVIEKRLKVAEKEIEKADMYQYWVLNDEFEEAYTVFKSIFLAERSRSERLFLEGRGLSHR